ncbi:MAG: hypothetical protein ACRDNZ_18810 [Streptosporangiaceae bacterium]
MKDSEGLSIAALGRKLGVSKARAADMLRVTDTRQPEPPAVVAAIVTSPLGVLLGRRNDGTPPWTFIAGQLTHRSSVPAMRPPSTGSATNEIARTGHARPTPRLG